MKKLFNDRTFFVIVFMLVSGSTIAQNSPLAWSEVAPVFGKELLVNLKIMIY
jgi:hypothetical protein